MKNIYPIYFFLCVILSKAGFAGAGILPNGCLQSPGDVVVVPHEQLKKYGLNGNTLVGVATEGMGAKETEVWRTSWVWEPVPLCTCMTRKRFSFSSRKRTCGLSND